VISPLSVALEAAERGLVADRLLRAAIRSLCRDRLRTLEAGGPSKTADDLIRSLTAGPIAVETEKANAQHYELPPEFFGLILGPRRTASQPRRTRPCPSRASGPD
jgi:cyclopropane-fatty-acyl-phospholipid synthase